MASKDRTNKPLPPGATREEEDQLDELAVGHPWSLTVREFLVLIGERYGVLLVERVSKAPDGNEVVSRYLQSADKETVVQLPADFNLEDQLDTITTRSICRRIRIPPEDFGLPPEEKYEDFDFDLN